MDKQNAIQDLSYIKKLMSETQQIMDIVWPIYMYWGIFFVSMNTARIFFPYETFVAVAHVPASVIISESIITIFGWGGMFFTAIYIFRHRERMFDKKMFLLGMLGLSFVLIYITIVICEDIIQIGSNSFFEHPHKDYNILIHGLYFAALFIVFGLVYTREQLWLGYGVLIMTILTIYLGIEEDTTHYTLVSHTMSITVGLSFIISGVMAYRRYRKQVRQEV